MFTAGLAQRLENRLEFVFQDRKIAIHEGVFIAACKSGPRVDSHLFADCGSPMLGLAANDDLVHAGIGLSAMAKQLIDGLSVN